MVLITCSSTEVVLDDGTRLYHHAVFEKYVEAIVSAGAVPLLLPCIGNSTKLVSAWLGVADGVLLTGDASHVSPERYGGRLAEDESALDPHRDATVLPLIRPTIARGIPLLAICRGAQELNVAFGGTLLQRVHEHPCRFDHRSNKSKAFEERYRPAHRIGVAAGGLLARLLEDRAIDSNSLSVNSLHSQAIDEVAEGIFVEARSDDTSIEAISVSSAQCFAMGLQWHPEWYTDASPLDQALFDAFIKACAERAKRREMPR